MKKMASAFILLIILSLALVLASETGKAQLPTDANIIRIRSDATVEGTDKIQRNGDVYTLTGDINGYVGSDEAFIFVERDNVVIDGAGHTVQGNGGGTGILMLRRQGVTIKNTNIKGFGIGINFWAVLNFPSDSKYWGLPPASSNLILDNNIETPAVSQMAIEAPGWGIYLQEASGTLISGNTITTHDPNGGVFFGFRCDKTTLLNNKFVGSGLFLTSSNQNTIINNTVDDKPLIHLDGASNQVVDGAGQVFLFNSNNMTVRNVDPLVNLRISVYLSGTSNSEITNSSGHITLADSSNNNTISGNRLVNVGLPVRTSASALALLGSQYTTIFGNDITISGEGIHLENSAYNNIYGNNLRGTETPNNGRAIYLTGSTSNSIHGNSITESETAIYSQSDMRESIYENEIKGCNVGISLSGSSEYSIFGNNITDSQCGVSIYAAASNNAFYNNNFVNNKVQASESHETLFYWEYAYSVNNTWDSGYPSGGNYWSDYNGTDDNGDGIGDTPYIVFENMTDHYPLMKPIAFDTTPPAVSIISPENKTYAINNIPLTFSLNEPASSIAYSLDGQEHITITGNTTLTGLPNGSHSLTVYANDTTGNTGTSETIYFSIAKEPESFPTTEVATAAVVTATVVGAGLLIYFRKHKS